MPDAVMIESSEKTMFDNDDLEDHQKERPGYRRGIAFAVLGFDSAGIS